jgi:hypothetical protein
MEKPKVLNNELDRNITLRLLGYCVGLNGKIFTPKDVYDKAIDYGYFKEEERDGVEGLLKIIFGRQRNLSDLQYRYRVVWSFMEDNLEPIDAPINVVIKSPNSPEDQLVVKSDSIYRYLEYVELQEARANSKKANRQSLWAIGISLAALVVTCVFGFVQMNTPLELGTETIKAIRAPQEKVDVKELQAAPPPVEPAIVYERVLGQGKNGMRMSGDTAIAEE